MRQAFERAYAAWTLLSNREAKETIEARTHVEDLWAWLTNDEQAAFLAERGASLPAF